MELSQLLIFKEIADAGSIQGAAQRMHRVPSNLTTRLRQLEGELGAELFIREKMRLRLSASGHIFLKYVRSIFDLLEEARMSVSGDTPCGSLSLGALESTAAVHIPPILAKFHQYYPEVMLDLATGPSGDLIQRVVDGQLAAAFVDGPIFHAALTGVHVFEDELVLISAKGRAPIERARDVIGASIYAFRSNCSYRKTFENWFESDNSSPGQVFEMESYHGMLACVSAAAGLALVPLSMLAGMPNNNAVQVHALDQPFRQVRIFLVWRKNLRLPALRRLIELLHESDSRQAQEA